MNYIFKILVILQFIYQISIKESFTYNELLWVLLIIALYVIKERFWNSSLMITLQLFVIAITSYFYPDISILYTMVAFDYGYKKNYIGIMAVALTMIALGIVGESYILFLTAIAFLLGYILREKDHQHMEYLKALDEERRARYSLEVARKKLLTSQEKTIHLAEIQERNRIARDIHDSIGHSIAGVLIQMQVAGRLLDKDILKAKDAINKSINKLTEALNTIRDTVHNLKPTEKVRIEYIKEIIEDYTFCPVEFKHEGNFENIPTIHMETIAAIIKEALTNTTKYSKATEVTIQLQSNEKFTRLYYKDNGIGCSNIRTGMGLKGMKERVDNLGGNLTISSNNGFMIVGVLFKN